ncbi:MAG: domain S-box protein [Nocardioides sp.]|nr:domain S-box protein [Nocardioides sp.]
MNGDAGSEFSRVGPQIIFGMDTRGRCTMSIGPGLRELGLEDGELVGRDLFEVYRDNPLILASLGRVLAGETFTVAEEVEGRLLWTYFQPLHDADGTLTGSFGVTTDVTDQRRAEAAASAARIRVTALSNLSAELTRGVLEPDEVLRIGVRVATEAFADVGVIWLLDDEGRLQPRAAWHPDAAAREQLDRAIAEIGGREGWLDPGSVAALQGPVTFDLEELVRPGPSPSDEIRALVVGLGLRHGLRLPVRSRGRVAGLLDFGRGADAGSFSDDDVAFGLDVADRFTLAYDNALLLAEQRAALAELLKFKSLAEASGDLIALADVGGDAVYVNPQVETTGIRMRSDNLWETVRAYADGTTVAEMRRVAAEGGRWTGDLELDIDGSTIIVRTEVFPLSDPGSGEPLGNAWIGQDVTTLRQTERALRAAVADLTKFQSLVEASSDFIAIADLESRVEYVNPAGRAMIGLPADADVRGTAINDYLTPEGEASLGVERPAVLDRGHWEGESTLRDLRGGPPIPVAIASFLMRDGETGEPFALASVQRDITERRSADQAVRELAEQRQALLARLVRAQEAERAQIAGDVHDDPVQALAAVDLRLGLLRRQLEKHAPQLLDTLGPVQESVARANDRLRALLFDLEAPDLERGLGSALERAAAEILKDAGVGVVVDAAAEPDADPSTRAVAYRIAREALINVRKHARAHEVTVTISGGEGGLAVEIADDGRGLAGEAESPPGHHGLSGMRDRAVLAGGQLGISSRPAGGTVVAFWLPAGQVPEEGLA